MVYRYIINKRNYEILSMMDKLRPHSVTTLRIEANITHAHLTNLLNQFSSEGIIIKEPTERLNTLSIKLTPKGKDILSHLISIEKIMQKEVYNGRK